MEDSSFQDANRTVTSCEFVARCIRTRTRKGPLDLRRRLGGRDSATSTRLGARHSLLRWRLGHRQRSPDRIAFPNFLSWVFDHGRCSICRTYRAESGSNGDSNARPRTCPNRHMPHEVELSPERASRLASTYPKTIGLVSHWLTGPWDW